MGSHLVLHTNFQKHLKMVAKGPVQLCGLCAALLAWSRELHWDHTFTFFSGLWSEVESVNGHRFKPFMKY